MILRAQQDEVATQALESWPEGAEILLDAINAGEVPARANKLIGDLKNKQVDQYLKNNDGATGVLMALLDVWKHQRLLKVPKNQLSALVAIGSELKDTALAKLFRVAMSAPTRIEADQAIEVFQELQSRKKLSGKSRAVIDGLAREHGLPEDDPEVALLGSAFVGNKWSVVPLFSLDLPMLKQVLESKASAQLIPLIARELEATHLELTDAQKNALGAAMATLDDPTSWQAVWGVIKHRIPWAG